MWIPNKKTTTELSEMSESCRALREKENNKYNKHNSVRTSVHVGELCGLYGWHPHLSQNRSADALLVKFVVIDGGCLSKL